MFESYTALQGAVERAGFFTAFQVGWMGSGRLVCASRQDDRGLGGVSFWVAERGGRWYLGMWGGDVFRFEDPAALTPACVRFVADESVLGYCLRVPAALRDEYRLVELSEKEAGTVFPEGEDD